MLPSTITALNLIADQAKLRHLTIQPLTGPRC